jgi:hypothetical protein
MKEYFDDPIVAPYFFVAPRPKMDDDLEKYVKAIKDAKARSIWIFVQRAKPGRLDLFMDLAQKEGLTVVPVLFPEVSIIKHPEVRIISADGSISDDPRYWNIGCYNHPYVIEKSKEAVKNFLSRYKDHPALYKINGRPLVSFIHEAYYRTDVPEFGGGHLKPCCYCEHCIESFRETMKQKFRQVENFNSRHKTDFADWALLEPPREPSNASFWKEWLDYHAEIIPSYLRMLIEYANTIMRITSTHELNDFYPCSYQCVYSGNDIWRMAKVLDIGHEDMYPLEFDHRYVIYIYDYIKDALRTAMGFDKLYTANGQSFNSWLGYKVPPASMFEQVYSCLIHGALGIVWWVDWGNLDLWAKTKRPNEEYTQLVGALRDYELSKAEIVLIYPWTGMELKTDDAYSMDNLLFYMALVRSGFPVDIVSEQQIAEDLLQKRRYKAVCAVGCPVLPPKVADKIREFVKDGGMLIQDYEGEGVGEYHSIYPQLAEPSSADHIIYTVETDLPLLSELNGRIIPVGNKSEKLKSSANSTVIAKFEDGDPAVIQNNEGKGKVIKVGSLLGWDYSNYPGHYDFAVMFPLLIRRNETVRKLVAKILNTAGVQPPAESSNANVEVGTWRGKDKLMLFAVNHLDQPSETVIAAKVEPENRYDVQEFFTEKHVDSKPNGNWIGFKAKLSNFQGKAYTIKKA